METKHATRDLVIERVFDAPLELVWRAWSEPDLFKRWWGPEHFTAPVAQINFRVGGRYLNCMRAPDGQDYWSTGMYTEIVPQERIVYTDSFADEKGNAVPADHYGMSGFPMEMKVIVTLGEENGKTKMTLCHAGLPAGEMGDQTSAGWNQSFDKLAAELAKV